MKLRTFFRSAVPMLMLALAYSGVAAEPPGSDDARDLLSKAAAYFDQNGPARAFCAFNAPSGPFHKGPLYVFAISMDGVYLAHSAAPTLVGVSLRDTTDAAGQLVGKAIMESIATQGEGAVDYKWLNYSSNKVEQKHTYVKKAGEFVLGVGYYTR
jgi:cytochrome c